MTPLICYHRLHTAPPPPVHARFTTNCCVPESRPSRVPSMLRLLHLYAWLSLPSSQFPPLDLGLVRYEETSAGRFCLVPSGLDPLGVLREGRNDILRACRLYFLVLDTSCDRFAFYTRFFPGPLSSHELRRPHSACTQTVIVIGVRSAVRK